MSVNQEKNNTTMPSFDPSVFEGKWQAVWEKEKVYQPDLAAAKKPYYNLMMFPYPSAEGLHVGNMYAFTGVDIYGRFQRMQGNDVFEPIGLDGFGIHSENYALKVGRHPKEQAVVSQKNFYRQLHAIGNGFAWKNTVETYDPGYYKFTQWLFIQMFNRGLAYRKKAQINFCPSCKTVLSDEQVINGTCERCKSTVEKREMEQWFFKITEYAEKLYQNTFHPDFHWSDKVKIGQRNWIGRKEGINITYQIVDSTGQPVLGQDNQPLTITCFTTRPDTNFGATFIVMAPEYSLVDYLLSSANVSANLKGSIRDYVSRAKAKSDIERIAEGRKKTGVATGLYALNHLTGKKMPIFITDFVLSNVGTGAVVGVPGHDKRDFEFAQAFNLPVIRVVIGTNGDKSEITKIEQVQEEEGTMVNSGFLDGMDIHKATVVIMDYIEKRGWGKRVVTYRLRDWCISRQRYWGAPIPMVYCESCAKKGNGWVPVSEKDLPVLLPDLKDWKPEGNGRGPLAKLPEFYNTTCPDCGGKAVRETDVCDTFLDSSWYFLRYPSVMAPTANKLPFDPRITKKWLPVDIYIGGAEHTVLHLLYARFVTMALADMGYIDFEEPFKRFYAHGLIISEGAKMSKSKGNIIVPDEYIRKYGADTLRTYLMFLGPFDMGGDFRDTGIAGMYRFLGRVWRLVQGYLSSSKQTKDDTLLRTRHKAIKEVTEDMANLRYNTAISHIMEFVNEMQSIEIAKLDPESIKTLLLVLAPFAPHMTEELWQLLKGEAFKSFESIHTHPWPKYNPEYVKEEQATVVIQINGKLRDSLILDVNIAKDQKEVEKLVLGSSKVQKFLNGAKPKKTIFIPGKLVNFVV